MVNGSHVLQLACLDVHTYTYMGPARGRALQERPAEGARAGRAPAPRGQHVKVPDSIHVLTRPLINPDIT